MQSRSKKYRKSFDTYEQAIEKQLHDDFQVNQYLNQNQLEGNIEEYLKLFNSLQVNNGQKKKKYDTLKVSYQQMNTDRLDQGFQLSKISNWDGAKQSFINQFQQIQINTSNQNEVKNTLWNEIIQTKKSLNLLKGDVGHLISRNQSANILESKISKVNIVADDQLKRVSLAYSKDKEEIKERKDMQRKFNKKLKNASMFENSSLNNLKKNYMNTMVRKKRMHDRLAHIEKIGSSIQQTGDKERLKNFINKNTLELYKNFQKLVGLIQKMSLFEKQNENSQQQQQIPFQFYINDILSQINSQSGFRNDKTSKSFVQLLGKSKIQDQQIEAINSSDLEMVKEQNLRKFQQIIKCEYQRVSLLIENQTIEYNFNMKKSQELATKLFESNEQIDRIQFNWLEDVSSKYVLSQAMKQTYFQKLKKFIQSIKTFFVLLEFIQKHINYSTHLFYQENHQQILTHTQNFQPHKSFSLKPQLNRPNSHSHSSKSLIPSNKSLKMIQKSYISDLHKIYCIFLRTDSQDETVDDINFQIFQQLKCDLQGWLDQIKDKIIQGKQLIRPSLHRNSYRFQRDQTEIMQKESKMRSSLFSHPKKAKTFIQTEQQEINEVKQQYQQYLQNFNKRHATTHQQNTLIRHSSAGNLHDKNKLFKSTIGFLLMKGLQHSNHSKIANIDKLKNSQILSSQQNPKKPIRIKFLQNVDKDYYKMIKSTIKMQKQNTRKNYQFQKTFNRSKYTSNDEILEQKRFESSFSMLFADKNQIKEKIYQCQTKKSAFFIRNKSQNRLSKLQDSSKSIASSQVFKNQKLSKLMSDKKSLQPTKRSFAKISDKSLQHKRHNLSIQMKDIINLV